MASIPASNNRTALVTGISGYQGAWVGMKCLEAGYKIRGVVRRPESIASLLSGPWQAYHDAGRIETVTIPDMIRPGCFDEAVVGVDIIQHVASPVTFNDVPLSQYVEPAVGMNRELLESALARAGPQLKSVVVTSSIAAVYQRDEDREFGPSDWNTRVEQEGQKNPSSLTIPERYAFSKVAAERFLWRFEAERKPHFSISTVLPGIIFGPLLLLPAKPEQFSISVQVIWRIWAKEEIPPELGAGCYIDVRDVARMQVWAAEHPLHAGGKRYVLGDGRAGSQAAADILNGKFPGRGMKKGTPGEVSDAVFSFLMRMHVTDVVYRGISRVLIVIRRGLKPLTVA